MSNGEWKTIGHIGVDTARLLIIDPCYLSDLFSPELRERINQEQEAWFDITATRPYGALRSKEWKFHDDSEGAFIISTGYGDGTYTIEARTVKDERGHDRTAEIRIRFIEDEELEAK